MILSPALVYIVQRGLVITQTDCSLGGFEHFIDYDVS
jgi:hypothetical protein